MAASLERLNDLLSCVQLVRERSTVHDAGRYNERLPAAAAALRAVRPSLHQRQRFGGVMFLAEAAAETGEHDKMPWGADRPGSEEVAALEPLADAARPSPLRTRGPGRCTHWRQRLSTPIRRARDLARWPWLKARAELAYGRWLRRQRRDAASGGAAAERRGGFLPARSARRSGPPARAGSVLVRSPGANEMWQLVGRNEEMRVLAGLVDQARAAGAAIAVLGDPGIGQVVAAARGSRLCQAIGPDGAAEPRASRPRRGFRSPAGISCCGRCSRGPPHYPARSGRHWRRHSAQARTGRTGPSRS